MVTKRVNVLWAILGVVGGMAVGAWYMGSRIQSPAEMAARTAAPEPSAILVPVESRALSSDIVTRGTVRFGLPQPISIAPSTVKGGVGLISSLPRPNSNFGEGEVILSASGRPVFVLSGAAPAFRDMAPGASGADVRQLEEALARLGFNPGTVDGNYDQKTSAAVERLYQKAGWDAFGPTREQRAAVAALEREWSDASRAQLAAEATRETAVRAVAAARAIAEQNTRQAALDSAVRVGDSRQLADARAGKSLALETERARASHSATAASADVATQIADRALIVLDPRQTETARAAAEAKLKVARAAQRKAKLEADLAIKTAEREAGLAEGRIQVAEAAVKAARLEGERSMRAAQEQQTLAEFDVQVASERAGRLERELVAARAKLGAATSLKLVFHRYADNAKDEALMREYAASLGFLFNPVWAYVTSVERVMAIRSGREIYADDNALLDRLAMPFGEALDIVGQEPMSTCYHKTDRLVIDPKGQVMLCCASSGHPSNVVGDFLGEPFTEIEERMERHSLCGACMQQGVPNYFLFSETGERGFDEAAQKRRHHHESVC